MQPVNQMMPVNPMQGQAMFNLPQGLAELNNLSGVYVKQSFETIEAVTCCETQNCYKVFPADSNGQLIGDIKQGVQPVLVCKEKSGFCARQCCASHCRPLRINVFSNADYLASKGQNEDAAIIQGIKPYKCQCLCCNRITMDVLLKYEGKVIGSIKDEFSCCSLKYTIKDINGAPIYQIDGSCCQCGFLCKECPCSPCQSMSFNVKDGQGMVIGQVLKKSSGCCKAFCGDADDFSIGFPNNTSLNNKILLTLALLMIDYGYFESNGGN